jgi:hypothetical protein
MDAVSFPQDQCERALRLTGFRPESAASFLLDPVEGGLDQYAQLAQLLPMLPLLASPDGDEEEEAASEPPDFRDLVARLVDAVRFPPDHCESALRSSQFDLERAAAMLLAADADRAPIEERGQEPHVTVQAAAGEDAFVFTDDEKAQIARLVEITGRDRDYVIQLFLACDKNEEATANCLLEGK